MLSKYFIILFLCFQVFVNAHDGWHHGFHSGGYEFENEGFEGFENEGYEGFESEERFGQFGPQQHNSVLISHIGEDVGTALTRMPAGTKAAKGNVCTTPDGRPGACVYITDSACAPILNILKERGVNWRILNYLQHAIRSPCGFDVTDYTLCCEGADPAPVTPSPAVPVETTPSPHPPTPVSTPCGFSERVRIVGGTNASPGDWPWSVIIGKPKEPNFQVVCGGTLISSHYVLTAAHCFVGQASPSTHVRLGEHDITTTADGATTEDIQIKKVTTHESFSTINLQNDIAIIELATGVSFRPGVRPACLPDQYVGQDLSALKSQPTIVGWGATVTGRSTATVLQQANVAIVSKDTCAAAYDPISKISISDNQICAGTGQVDTCAGDSGGPILSDQFGRFSVIGITSFGVKCGDPTYPGVYTRVDKYLDWIAAKTP